VSWLCWDVSDPGRLVYGCGPSRLFTIVKYSSNACERSDIRAIWRRIGEDAKGAKSRGNRDILDNISGTAARIESNQAAMESPIR
jgi:hypothetical protein